MPPSAKESLGASKRPTALYIPFHHEFKTKQVSSLTNVRLHLQKKNHHSVFYILIHVA
jgi:hypothetical protein